MSSPFSSNLLNRARDERDERIVVDDARDTNGDGHVSLRERMFQHDGATVHEHAAFPAYAAAPAPMMPAYQPQPVYVDSAARGGGGIGTAVSAVVLGLLVLLLGIVALVGGYVAARTFAPSQQERALTTRAAYRDGALQGRVQGIARGRQQVADTTSTTSALRVAAARQSAYQRAYARGVRAGRSSWRAPRWSGAGYRGGYRGWWGRGNSNWQVQSALGQAQNLANVTGAPVDVEVYG